jgi:hypothetical protein
MQRAGLKATPAVAPRQPALSILARLEKKKRGQTIDELVEDSEIKKLLGECSRAQRLQLVRLELGKLSVEGTVKVEEGVWIRSTPQNPSTKSP